MIMLKAACGSVGVTCSCLSNTASVFLVQVLKLLFTYLYVNNI